MKSFNKKYYEIKLYYICVMLVLGVTVNSGLKVNGIDIIENFANTIKKILNVDVEKTIYLVAALAAIYLATLPNFWLPFLGNSVLPHQLIPLKQNKKFDTILKVKVPKNSKVAYWAANPSDETPFVFKAYGEYNNSGIVMANEDGVAELKVVKGSGYNVPSGRYIQPHVHYRVLNEGNGMMGPVKTEYYK